jgi:hypothetical protein
LLRIIGFIALTGLSLTACGADTASSPGNGGSGGAGGITSTSAGGTSGTNGGGGTGEGGSQGGDTQGGGSMGGAAPIGSGGSASGSSGSGGASPFAAAIQNCTGSTTSSVLHTFTLCQFALVQEAAEPFNYTLQFSANDAGGDSLDTELDFLPAPAIGSYDSSDLSNHDRELVTWMESMVTYSADVSAESPTPFGTSHVELTSVTGPFVAGPTVSYYLVHGTLTASAPDVGKAESVAVSVTF